MLSFHIVESVVRIYVHVYVLIDLSFTAPGCSRAMLQMLGDHDWCFPASMASGSQGVAKFSSADGSAASRERVAGSVGALRPSRGAEDVYAQARTLFRAMVQMPHYAEEVSSGLLGAHPIEMGMVKSLAFK